MLRGAEPPRRTSAVNVLDLCRTCARAVLDLVLDLHVLDLNISEYAHYPLIP